MKRLNSKTRQPTPNVPVADTNAVASADADVLDSEALAHLLEQRQKELLTATYRVTSQRNPVARMLILKRNDVQKDVEARLRELLRVVRYASEVEEYVERDENKRLYLRQRLNDSGKALQEAALTLGISLNRL